MDSATLSPLRLLHTGDAQHNKALKGAFYNAAALVFVVISGVILVSAYFVLETFLRPLIWASLCGAFIFPFKKRATRLVLKWLNALKKDQMPLIVGISLLPILTVNEGFNVLKRVIRSNIKLLVVVFVVFINVYLLAVYQPYYYIHVAIEFFHSLMTTMLKVFSYPYAVCNSSFSLSNKRINALSMQCSFHSLLCVLII